MTQAPSSTSSSDTPRYRGRTRTVLWMIAGVVSAFGAFEACVAILFSMPPDAREPSGSLGRYFSYGYSTESKLIRSVGSEGQTPTAIIRAGWIPTELYPPGEDWADAPRRVIFYGMSFTNRTAAQLRAIRPDDAILTRAGPAAPFSHSAAMFEADPWRTQADTVVVGILASSIPYLRSTSGLGFTPESPAPYAFPMYTLQGDGLVKRDPPISDRDEFVREFRARSPRWFQQRDWLRAEDAYWDPFVFSRSMLDRSAIIRLVRRAWASMRIDTEQDRVYNHKRGYRTDDPALAAVPVMLRSMNERCSADGQHLIVLLLHTRGEPGHLRDWLAPELAAAGITTISTTDLFSSTDPMNFMPDSHYRSDLDALIAGAVDQAMSTRQDDTPRP